MSLRARLSGGGNLMRWCRDCHVAARLAMTRGGVQGLPRRCAPRKDTRSVPQWRRPHPQPLSCKERGETEYSFALLTAAAAFCGFGNAFRWQHGRSTPRWATAAHQSKIRASRLTNARGKFPQRAAQAR